MTLFQTTIQDVRNLLAAHENYRGRCLNLIASENIPSPTVRKLLTSDLGGRYPTYYDDPRQRNYKGTRFMAEIEVQTQELAKECFNANYVDFRPLGGHLAGVGAICGLTRPGDTVFETGDWGGHKTASKLVSAQLLKGLLNVEYIPYQPETHDIDMPRLVELVREKKPRLIIFGRDQILFPEDISPIRTVADEVDAFVAYDMSHVHELIAGKAFPNPLDLGADVLLGSHHKTMPGPQGGLYLTRKREVYEQVRRGLYPPFVTNHHVERLPALAATYIEIREFGQAYAQQIVRNSAALGRALYSRGLDALYPERGFSQSHQVIVDVTKFGTGGQVANRLEEAHIICGATPVPADLTRGGGTSSGLRLGTQELARIGMVEQDMDQVAELIKRVVVDGAPCEQIAAEVATFVTQFKELRFCFERGVHPYASLWQA